MQILWTHSPVDQLYNQLFAFNKQTLHLTDLLRILNATYLIETEWRVCASVS